MLQLALNGITSFSLSPIRLITIFGITLSSLGLCSIITLAVLTACGTDISAVGWTLSSVWTACGFLMTCLGIVGEYVGKSYEEIKARPRYIIEEFVQHK